MTETPIKLTVSQYRAVRHLIESLTDTDKDQVYDLGWIARRVASAFSGHAVTLRDYPVAPVPPFKRCGWPK